ncbi:bifunctional 3-deoxy-7-phosphoheptulonate synthase/chorismate mutase [Symbiobacterium thermophilum]|uniref:bifunctional 3-deoxy-7-phosphoheptulonate synthase/chorismate mutase n=1 Tax=Symbiobacterium thermophilum TaxID=2734 RepID=UPI0035C71B05
MSVVEGLTAETKRTVAGRFAGLRLGSGRPMIIAGPCSVESEEQIVAAARAVKAAGATALRGGAFKPRTSPRSFQGLGEEGLRLLAVARAETGLPVVTEVMDTAQIDLVAEYADVLQVGSRNMQNFALLKQVGRAGKPVLLKRGLSATLEEWLAAAEYILESGNDQVILCERGIRTFETSTRNTLDLSTAILARTRSGLPVIVDPSHAAGRRDLIEPLSLAALAAGMDGLMIEVHPDPDRALSDAAQQLNFEQFSRLMARLELLPASALESIDACREEIDRLDERILDLLLRRMAAARRVGQLKRGAGLPVLQEDREHALIDRLAGLAGDELAGEEVREIWQAILAVSRRAQQALHA